MTSQPISSESYDEQYRPQLHYSPPSGWINDPNGLVYHDGIYHLFNQNNPNDIIPGPISWGHSISSDLVHWKTLPQAIPPTDGNSIFSGSAIIDNDNITGLRINDNIKSLIAVFTAHDLSTNEEKQWLAYSNDGPEYEKFQFYENNPIIPNPNPKKQNDFRDPSVFKYKDRFVIILAAHNHVKIYNSLDLLKWKPVSEFGLNDGSHAGTWECPSLFPIKVTIDGLEVEKYVLITGLTDNAIPSTQYFIGSFDGETFTNDNSKETELWLDFGPDSYAGITYNEVPDGRRIFISWMNNWFYAAHLNFNVWNGQMGLPRELKLNQVGDRILLSSLPVREIETLRVKPVRMQNVLIVNDFIYKIDVERSIRGKKHLVDIEMSLDLTNLKEGDSFDVVFSDENDKIKISFKGNEFILDRTNAGRTDFPNFGRLWKAPRFINSSALKLRIIIDRSSIELFADDGLTVMTALFYSKEDIASQMAIYVHSSVKGSTINLKELNVYQMKSIWNYYS